MIPVLLGVIIVIFTINYISPSDPLMAILGANATEEQRAEKAEELGLDQPYIIQLGRYIVGVCKLDLGTSYITKNAVLGNILERFPTTFLLAVLAVALATLIGIPLGIIAAIKRTTIFDYVSSIIALIGASMPGFLVGLLLILAFAVNLKWLPASGISTPRHWILPVIAVGIFPIATIMRTTRSSMLEVIRQDYIRTAKSKGLRQGKIITKHALKNALIPVITIVGMQLSFVMGGVIVTEAVFNIPGMGLLIKDAIAKNDYPTIQGAVLFVAAVMCVINLIVDVIYAYVDPRLKAQYEGRKRTPKISKQQLAVGDRS